MNTTKGITYCIDSHSVGEGYLSALVQNAVDQHEPHDLMISTRIPGGTYDSSVIQSKLLSFGDMSEKIVCLLDTDSTQSFEIPPNVFLYRTSLYKSLKKKNEDVLAYVWSKKGCDFVLSKTDKPIIGFCGALTDISRIESIQYLSHCPDVSTNFIIRDKCWNWDPTQEQKIDFENNLIFSHFNICNRGTGNFSMRFYETLSSARIPYVVYNDMVFPFENEIPWDALIARGKTPEEATERVLFLFNNDVEFRQSACKSIYDSFFEKSAYFKRIIDQSHSYFMTI